MIKKLTAFMVIIVLLVSLAFSSNAIFVDIANGSYYADGAFFCGHNGILPNLTTSSYFYPSDNANRSAAIYGVVHALGLSPSNYVNTGFSDVPYGSVYAGSVKWAVDNGVTAGTGGGLFGASDLVTREGFCVFVYNTCLAMGVTLPNLRTYTGFADSSNIHSWALTAIREMYEAELLSGYTNGNVGPLDNITRGQISVVLFKLYLYQRAHPT